MKKEPVLVIMAAGMGSRFGGLKQMEAIDDVGNIIMDYSIYDAIAAGFKKVVFIIKHQIEEDFKNRIGNKLSKYIDVEYVFQEITALPKGVLPPNDRIKPYGTGHAVLCCKDIIDGPFAVINADDFYGKDAFEIIYDRLISVEDDDKFRYTMVGYQLTNTLTENGYVSRGVCQLNESNYLVDIIERTRIERHDGNAVYSEDDGTTWTVLSDDTIVSMNMWGFTKSFLVELEKGFEKFLQEELPLNPIKAEYYLPTQVSVLLSLEIKMERWIYLEDLATRIKEENEAM